MFKHLLLIALSIFLFSACGGSGTGSSGTGAVSFDVKWDQQSAESLKSEIRASSDVCSDYGIETIHAGVFNSSNSEIASMDWTCSAHSGSITNVPVGSNYTVYLQGLDSSGTITWQGSVTGISVTANTTASAGTITMTYIGNDSTPPYIVSFDPSQNATDVPATTTITATFNEKIAPSTINTDTFTLFDYGTNSYISGAVSYDSSTKTATFTPASNLSYSTQYQAWVHQSTGGVQDMAGWLLTGTSEWYFTTEAAPTTPTPITLASGLSNPKSIAVDSTSVYWTEYGSGTVKKVSINGGTVTTIASGLVSPEELSLTVDSANVYYGDGSTLYKVSTSGGTVTTLASGLNYPQGVQVDSTDAYWVDAYGGGQIKKVGLSGGTVTILVSSGLNYASSKIAIDSSNVYWAEYQGNTIKKVSKSGGTVTTLASGLNNPYAGVAVDSTNVYWTEYGSGTVKKVSINGGTVTTIASGLNDPYDIAVDSTSVYWTERAGGAVGSGAVKKVSINGGTVTTIASGLNDPYGIVIDSTNAYWTEYGGGTVKKIAK